MKIMIYPKIRALTKYPRNGIFFTSIDFLIVLIGNCNLSG